MNGFSITAILISFPFEFNSKQMCFSLIHEFITKTPNVSWSLYCNKSHLSLSEDKM